MKINGLNDNDFEWVGKAFRHLMSDQTEQIREAVECGHPTIIKDSIEPLKEALKTYEKIKKETDKYES